MRTKVNRWGPSNTGGLVLPPQGEWPLLDGLVADAARHRERLERWWEGELPAGEILNPIIIAGAYRTGTTFLHRALANAMPERRTLLGWEATIPTPPPVGDLASRLSDPRCMEQQKVTDALFDVDPELRDLHYEPADLPAECVQAMAQTGLTGLWPAISYCPEYMDWLLSVDGLEQYCYYEQCLLTLDRNAWWLLKSPMHSLFLPTIFDLWPDAVVIRIRRNRDATVKSAVKFFDHLRRLSQPYKDHTSEILSWVGPYLDEHDRRVDIAEKQGCAVISVESSTMAAHPEQVVADVKERVGAYVHA